MKCNVSFEAAVPFFAKVRGIPNLSHAFWVEILFHSMYSKKKKKIQKREIMMKIVQIF